MDIQMDPNNPNSLSSNYDRLPEVYMTDEGEPVSDPCWRLLADGYYGDTLCLAGGVFSMSITPNHHMQPLNRAAGQSFAHWLEDLPLESTGLRQDDISDAAFELGSRESIPGMTKDQWNRAVVKLALEFKAKREGGRVPNLSALHGVRSLSTDGVRPMPNAVFTDPHLRGFGDQQGQVIHRPEVPGKRVRRMTPAVGSQPPGSVTPGSPNT